MKNFYFLVGLFTSLLLCSSCQKATDEAPQDLGYDFMPFNKGFVWEYEIDSIVYDDFNQSIDTYRYKLIVKFDDTLFGDIQTRKVTLQRQEKDRTKAAITSALARKTRRHFIWMHENIERVLLPFPPNLGTSFNEILGQGIASKSFEIKSPSISYTFVGPSDDDIIQTEFNYFDTVLTRYNERNLFQKQVGLIYHYFEFIDLQKDSGLVYEKRLIDFKQQ